MLTRLFGRVFFLRRSFFLGRFNFLDGSGFNRSGLYHRRRDRMLGGLQAIERIEVQFDGGLRDDGAVVESGRFQRNKQSEGA